MGHFEIITENLIETDFQISNSCSLDFFLLIICQETSSVFGEGTEFVQLLVESGLDNAAVAKVHRRLGDNGCLQQVGQFIHAVALPAQLVQKRSTAGIENLSHRGNFSQGASGGCQVPRCCTCRTDAGSNPFQIGYLFQQIAKTAAKGFLFHQFLDGVLPLPNCLQVVQRHAKHGTQKAATHSGEGSVHRMQQGAPRMVAPNGLDDFKRTE